MRRTRALKREWSALDEDVRRKQHGSIQQIIMETQWVPFVVSTILSVLPADALLFRFLINGRTMSGRNSFNTPKPILFAIVIPKLIAPSDTELWLGGSHVRARKAPAATPPTCEIEKCRVPSSCRARIPLARAYPVRDQKPLLPELKYRLSSCKALPSAYVTVR
jgi:hypothetical protein